MAFTGSYYFPQIQRGTHKRHISIASEHGLLQADTLSVVPLLQEPFEKGIVGNGSGIVSDSGDDATNSDEFTAAHYIGILDTDLTILTKGQKNFFITTVTILCCLSILGNVSTLIVNVRRKIRPFFRACLISLAFSDLVNTLFLSSAYLSQFTEEYVQTWRLGSVMCSLVPFATTAAILASSMTLVGIAVDRYYAVMKAVIGFWNPTVISCIVCMFCIWLASFGIASPVFTIYILQPVYILTLEQQHQPNVSVAATMVTGAAGHVVNNDIANNISAAAAANITTTHWEENPLGNNQSFTLIKEKELVDMCISQQKDVSLYYIIVFIIIFMPCIGAFFWFNIIIARKLWQRRRCITALKAKGLACQPRHQPKIQSDPIELRKSQYHSTHTLRPSLQNCNLGSGQTTSSAMTSATTGSTTTATYSSSNALPTVNCNAPMHNSREARHLRMFTIILLMMAVFVFLRLPAWVFLLLRLYGSYNTPLHWMLYFIFGLMNLASSVLNPLFYTFLTETIEYALRVKAQVTTLICGSCSMSGYCCSIGKKEMTKEKPKTAFPATMAKDKEPAFLFNCSEKFCGCCAVVRATWQCSKKSTKQEHTVHATASGNDDLCAKDSSDRDEGVDCSEEMEEDLNDFHIYNQRIYTIYPESLVSSSVNS